MSDLIGLARRRISGMLRHTYTRVPRIDTGGTDAYYEPIMGDGAPVTGQKCLWDDTMSTLVMQGTGNLEMSQDAMYVLWNDPIQVGDQVQNITLTDGTVAVLTANVEGVEVGSSGGAAAYRAVRLRDIDFP